MPKWIYYGSAVAILISGLFLVSNGRYFIEAMPVTLYSTNQLTGNFVIHETWAIKYKPGFPYIERLGFRSQRTGGACLVAHPDDIQVGELDGLKCNRNSDCKLNSSRVGWSAYCDASEQQCWVRPGSGSPNKPASAPFCNRSIDYDNLLQWSVGSHPANRTPLDISGIPSAQRVRWRVVACLNTLDNTGGDSFDCGKDGPNRQEVMGNIISVG